MSSWVLIVGASFTLACGGAEEPTPRASEPAPSEPPVADPAEETEPSEAVEDPGPPCEAHSDCEMITACCDCPRVPTAVHAMEAARIRDFCMRARCAGCEDEPPPGPELVARCVDAACVGVPEGAVPSTPQCTTDSECRIHSLCCTCPGVPTAMHVDAIERDNQRCARRSCLACDQAFDGPTPSGARCLEGACVPVP